MATPHKLCFPMTQNVATKANPYAAGQVAAEPQKQLTDKEIACRSHRHRKARQFWLLGTCLPVVVTAIMFLFERFVPNLPADPFLLIVVAFWVVGWGVASVASFYSAGTIADKIAYCLVAPMLMMFLLFALFFVMIGICGGVVGT